MQIIHEPKMQLSQDEGIRLDALLKQENPFQGVKKYVESLLYEAYKLGQHDEAKNSNRQFN